MESLGCFVYIIKCCDGMLYTGITNNFKRRVNEHNLGIKSCLQKSRRPVELAYAEKFSTRIEAAKKEKQIKNRKREYKLQLIEKFGVKGSL